MLPGLAWFLSLCCGFYICAGLVYFHAAVLLNPVCYGFAEGVCLDAEGAFLDAWAVCSELRLNSDDAYFKSKPQTLNPKPCYYEFSQHELLES